MSALSWSERYLTLAFSLFAVSFPLLWISVGYFGIAATASLSFFPEDGHCETYAMLGNHCFGDFAIFGTLVFSDSPWNDSLGYPASSLALFIPFFALGAVAGAWVGVAAYMLILVASSLVPAIWAGWPNPLRIAALVAVIGLGTAPVLAVLDRGNSAALLLTPLLVFAVAFIRGRRTLAIAMIVVLAAIKPQMLLLVLVLIAKRQWRDAGLAVVGASAFIALSFAAWPGNRFANFSSWVGAFFAYTEYQSPEVSYPYNLGAVRSVFVLYDTVVHWFPSAGPWRGILTEYLVPNSLWVTLAIIALAAAVLLWRGRDLEQSQTILLVILVIVVSPSVSFNYYLALLLVPVALIVRSPSFGKATRPSFGALDRGKERVWRNWLQIALLAIVMSPIVIPWQWLSSVVPYVTDFGDAGVLQLFEGPLVLLLFCVTLVSAMFIAPTQSGDNDQEVPAGVRGR